MDLWKILLLFIFLVFTASATADVSMEVGTVNLNKHIGMGDATVVETYNSYESPVVVAYIMTRNGSDSVDVRVKNVTSGSFEIFMEEPTEDNNRNGEDIGYIVIEEGNYTLEDGTKIEASTHSTSNVHRGGENFNGDEIFFDNDYGNPPVVLASLNTYNNQDFMSTTISEGSGSCNSAGCRPTTEKFGLEQEAGETGVSVSEETISWLAIQRGQGTIENIDFEAGVQNDGNNDGVDNGGHTITYSDAFTSTPITIVDGQSGAGSDGYWARSYGTHATDQHVTSAEEDQVGDDERSHTNDYFGYLAFESSVSSGSFCDYRSIENECIMNKTKSISPNIYNISSIFVSEPSARISSFSGKSTINITNSTTLSGIWEGNIHVRAENAVIKAGARFRPKGERIIIGN